MTEKVVLTKEQAEAIERWENGTQLLKAAVVGLLNHGADEPIAEMPTETLAKAIYIGYEVEPELKVGDFVDIGLFGVSKIAEVTGVKGDAIAINGSDEYNEFKINRVLTDKEKQEEKQRRWWRKHSRDVWELRKGDILRRRKGKLVEYVAKAEGENVWLEYQCVSDSLDYIKENFYVACFAENRLDVNSND